ncbi:hypothetical protein GEMRC1_006426 [Eukaryota sp. GEM-RC1]
MPSTPLLPGFSVRDYSFEKSYNKKHVFDYSCNIPVVQGGFSIPHENIEVPENVDTSLLNCSINTSTYGSFFSHSSKDFVPAFVEKDKVLRFFGYFLETVRDSPHETYRIRFCKIDYFLVDDTLQVLEPAEENSGLPSRRLPQAFNRSQPKDQLPIHS